VARSEGQKRSQQHEKSLAAKTGGRRTPGSGSQWFAKGDVRTDHLLIEAKYTGKRQITIKAEVLEKISEEAILGRSHSNRLHPPQWPWLHGPGGRRCTRRTRGSQWGWVTDEGLLSMDSKWREQARCSDLCHLGGMDPELFFPPRKKGLYQQSATVAKKGVQRHTGQRCPAVSGAIHLPGGCHPGRRHLVDQGWTVQPGAQSTATQMGGCLPALHPGGCRGHRSREQGARTTA
jgi:hypothetical protein